MMINFEFNCINLTEIIILLHIIENLMYPSIGKKNTCNMLFRVNNPIKIL